eukprot:TRINITY_DN673_c0_g1_i2.p1 TRINITY_DN673_c0_g1~~TRINITY_DN673_c0_g1_i2.p1  ORF type:complete len:224 (+),score=89.76 TRINITY_DN673_c0_g1_i2:100-672(+)
MEERKNFRFGLHTNKTLKYCPCCDRKASGNFFVEGVELSLNKHKRWDVEETLKKEKLVEDAEDSFWENETVETSRQKTQRLQKQQREMRLKEKAKKEQKLRKELGLFAEEEKQEQEAELASVGIFRQGHNTPGEIRQLQNKSQMSIELPKTNNTTARLHSCCRHSTNSYHQNKQAKGKSSGQEALVQQFS